MSKRVLSLLATAVVVALLVPSAVLAVRGTIEPALAVSATLSNRDRGCAPLNVDLTPPCIVWSVLVKGFEKEFVHPVYETLTPNFALVSVWAELSEPRNVTFDIGVDEWVVGWEIDPGEPGWGRKALKEADYCSGLGQTPGYAVAVDQLWHITHDAEWTGQQDGVSLQEPVTIPC